MVSNMGGAPNTAKTYTKNIPRMGSQNGFDRHAQFFSSRSISAPICGNPGNGDGSPSRQPLSLDANLQPNPRQEVGCPIVPLEIMTFLGRHRGKGGGEEGRREGGKEGRREGGKEGRREGGQEGRREGGKEGRREGGKEGRREGGKEGRREGGKEGRREGGKGKEGRREGGKEGRGEGGKEGRREGGKEGRREGGKEGRREGGKEGRREGGKGGRREGGKEGRREGGKEGRREGGKEGRREGRHSWASNQEGGVGEPRGREGGQGERGPKAAGCCQAWNGTCLEHFWNMQPRCFSVKTRLEKREGNKGGVCDRTTFFCYQMCSQSFVPRKRGLGNVAWPLNKGVGRWGWCHMVVQRVLEGCYVSSTNVCVSHYHVLTELVAPYLPKSSSHN